MKGNSMKIHGWCDTRATHMTQENIHMKIVSGCPDTADDGYGSMGHAQLRSNVLFIDTMWNLNSANLRAWGSCFICEKKTHQNQWNTYGIWTSLPLKLWYELGRPSRVSNVSDTADIFSCGDTQFDHVIRKIRIHLKIENWFFRPGLGKQFGLVCPWKWYFLKSRT